MTTIRIRPRSPLRHALAAFAALAVLAAGAAAHAQAAADESATPRPAIIVEKEGHCIEPADRIRRDHPDLLRHQRDQTVRAGVRGARVSLRTCVDCHASRSNGSVIGTSRNFCQGCHEFAAVRLDCFECHSPRPDGAPALAAAKKPEDHP